MIGACRRARRCSGPVPASTARPADRRAASLDGPARPGGPHEVDALERLDRPDKERRGRSGRFGDDVQTVVHAVDKVHVGPARRPVHDLVASGPSEPRMRRSIVLADVRLELDDPAGPPARGIVTDQPPTEQGARDRQGRQLQDPVVFGPSRHDGRQDRRVS
jgi:hypothetical protein